MSDLPPVEELMIPLRFTPEDLAANQQGTLGPQQQQRLKRLRSRTLWIGGLVFFGLALTATILLFLGGRGAGVLSLMGILLTMINALSVGLFGRQWMRFNADLSDEQVAALQGRLERVLVPNRRVNNYVLRIQDTDFFVTKEQFRLFRHEEPYRIYQAPYSGTLLAAEPLSRP